MAYLRVHGEKIFVGPCYNTVSSYHKHHNNWNQSSKPGISEKENDKILHRFVWSSDDLKFRSIVYWSEYFIVTFLIVDPTNLIDEHSNIHK